MGKRELHLRLKRKKREEENKERNKTVALASFGWFAARSRRKQTTQKLASIVRERVSKSVDTRWTRAYQPLTSRSKPARGGTRRDLIFKCKQIYIVAKAPPPVTQNRGLEDIPSEWIADFFNHHRAFLSVPTSLPPKRKRCS